MRALKELRPYTEYLYFHIKGEPLLHPLLPEFLDLAGEMGFQVNLTTNGVLLPELGERLAAAPALRQVNVSLHSYTDAHGEMERYVAAVADFARRAAGEGKYTVFRIWTLDRERGMDPVSRGLLERLGREFPGAGELARESGRRSVTLQNRIFLSFDEEFLWPSGDAPVVSETGACYGARSMCGVLCDGTVVPCCLDGEGECPLGNLFTEDFRDIIQSPAFEGMARGFRERRLTQDLCRRCGYRTRFDKAPKKSGAVPGSGSPKKAAENEKRPPSSEGAPSRFS